MQSNLLIVVTDLNSRKAFDIVNILRSLGYKDIVGTVRAGVCARRYLSMCYSIRVYKRLSDVKNDSPDRRIVVLPVEEDSLSDLLFCLDEDRSFHFHAPPPDSFDVVRDKWEFAKFCDRSNVLHPRTFFTGKLSADDPLTSKHDLLVKPRSGAGSRGVVFSPSDSELSAALSDPNFIVQSRVCSHDGVVHGFFFLAIEGSVVSYYGHERHVTHPRSGGVTLMSRATKGENLFEQASAIVSALNWSGLGMIEFMWDEELTSYVVIEFNPRTWGSILLSHTSGSNIIANYIRSLNAQSITPSDVADDSWLIWPFPWMLFRPDLVIKILLLKSGGNIKYINVSLAKRSRVVAFHAYLLALKFIVGGLRR